MAINTKAAYHLTAPGMHVQWGCKRYYFKKVLSDRALICEEWPYINGSHAYSVLVCNDMFYRASL